MAVDDTLAPTQAADLSELFERGAQDQQTPSLSDGGEEPGRIGRFFGRRRRAQNQDGAVEDSTPGTDDAADVNADLATVETVESGNNEAPSVVASRPVEVPAPSLALPGNLARDDVQQLDTVNDAEVDAREIDDVETAYAPRSSKTVADATPAELEDNRKAEDDGPLSETSDIVAGPVRSTSTNRLPVILNVVSDTTEHHISDVIEETGSIERQNVGTGTSSITANALVLPSTGADEQIQIQSDDGMIVTGSIDLPDGIASSGRSRGSLDSSDLDSDAVRGEVRNPEMKPVRASTAVSSYANARVQIAPDRRSKNAWPIAAGVGAGAVAIAAAGFIAGLALGWF